MTGTRVDRLFEAARSGAWERVAQTLGEASDDVRARGPSGVTLLHVAAELDDVTLAELLLDRGAEMEAEASWGHTPFQWAAQLGSARVGRLLLDRGAERHGLWSAAALGDLEDVRRYLGEVLRGNIPAGTTVSDAFHIACRNGHLEVAKLLLSSGAAVDAGGYFGASALHWASIGGHDDVALWLVDSGADRAARDPKFDSTPAGWAREGGHDTLARTLEEDA